MFTKQDIDLLSNQLAKLSDNYIGAVAAKTNLSRPTVSKFFNLQKIKAANTTKIYDAGLELIKEYKQQQQSRMKRAKALIDDTDEAKAQGSLNL